MDSSVIAEQCSHEGSESFDFPGVDLHKDFVSMEEEEELCDAIDSQPWTDSQSGRRKQVNAVAENSAEA